MGQQPANPQEPRDDPVLVHARKEALVAFLAWVAAGVYTIGYCTIAGYDLDGARLTTIWGVPSWVVWGILAPWIAAICFSVWFSLWFIKDEDLGSAPEDEADE